MQNQTVRFITSMKLRELHRQRETFRQTYASLEEQVALQETSEGQLLTLYEGLREIQFARQPLHPDVVNLDVLLYEARSGTLSPEMSELWLSRLQEEFEAGRLRSEFVYLFGALLEEWANSQTSVEAAFREESDAAQQELKSLALTAPVANHHREAIDALFDQPGKSLEEGRRKLVKTAEKQLSREVDEYELKKVLEGMERNIYRSAAIRGEAQQFLASDVLRKELLDALTIMLEDWQHWDWPASGLSTRCLWTRNKWRLYLSEDLPTLCLLEILADRWRAILHNLLGDSRYDRLHRTRQLEDLNAPAVIIQSEHLMLINSYDFGFAPTALPWEDVDPLTPDTRSLEEILDAAGELKAIRNQRIREQIKLRLTSAGGEEYGGDYENDSLNMAVSLIHAEIELARNACPDRPLYLLKTDIRNAYPTLPHDVLLTILEKFGLTEPHLEFFRRYLRVPVRNEDGSVERFQQGISMGFTLSRMLGDLFFRCLEKYVTDRVRVMIIRNVDDITLISPSAEAIGKAWEEINRFCELCGMQINTAKSGAVCLGGELPAGLPTDTPRWGCLQLDSEGNWSCHLPTLQAHIDQTRERIEKTDSILTWAELYNANAQYLQNQLALSANLGRSHRQSIREAFHQYHRQMFDEKTGIVERIRNTIHDRYPLSIQRVEIPESWIYWPITAGGVGVRNPMIIAAQYESGLRNSRPNPVPSRLSKDWETEVGEWSQYYEKLRDSVSPVDPVGTKIMDTLVKDFIQRGSSISGGAQQNLSSYWRWVLYTWGPEILKRFGTFRFLITELVPLQLISQRRMRDSSLEGTFVLANSTPGPQSPSKDSWKQIPPPPPSTGGEDEIPF